MQSPRDQFQCCHLDVHGSDQFQFGHRGADADMEAAGTDGSVAAGRDRFQCGHRTADVGMVPADK
eukprot:1715820-Karenia_brevis.AAC.1